jgi:hypothetical protein
MSGSSRQKNKPGSVAVAIVDTPFKSTGIQHILIPTTILRPGLLTLAPPFFSNHIRT